MWKGKRVTDRIEPQAEADFLRSLPPAVRQEWDHVALAVRNMIAEFAAADPSLVRSDVTFDDLEIGVGDSIDILDFTMRLEKAVGFELAEAEKEAIPDPETTRKLRMDRFVTAVCQVVAAHHSG